MVEKLLLCTAGVVSVIITTATTALVFMLAIHFTTIHELINILAIVAAILQVISIAMLVYLIWHGTRDRLDIQAPWIEDRKRTLNLMSIYSTFALVLVAGATCLVVFIWTRIIAPGNSPLVLGQPLWIILICCFVLSTLSILAQSLFFVLLLRRQRNQDRPNSATPETAIPNVRSVRRSDCNAATRSIYSSTFGRGTERMSSPPPVRDSDLRDSLHSILTSSERPTSSRTKLIGRQHSSPASKASSFEIANRSRQSQDSGFDTWDTSSLSPQMRQTVTRLTHPIRPSILQPIPGSRSPSPAKALEGPFPSPTLVPSPHLLSSSPPPTSQSFNYPSLRTGSFSASTSVDSLPEGQLTPLVSTSPLVSNEDHIHPLFRCTSPTPPPATTPRTTITAAPGSFAGLLITERTLSRMRSGSAPSSPLSRSGSFFFDARETLTPTSPTSPREFGPPSREMTPPIPDSFVLAATRVDSVR